MTPALIVAFIGTFVGALGAYFATARRLSGKIKTSDAAQLWEESRSLRQDLTVRNEYLRKKLDECSTKIDRLEEKLDQQAVEYKELYVENGNLKRAMENRERTIEELRASRAELAEKYRLLLIENDGLKAKIRLLEQGNG